MIAYRESVLRTITETALVSDKDWLLMGALGLCGEAGESAEVVKKHIFHGIPLDKDKLIKELGDVRWYLEVLCMAVGTGLKEVERLNVDKLQKRYPEKFTTQDSIEKKDEK